MASHHSIERLPRDDVRDRGCGRTTATTTCGRGLPDHRGRGHTNRGLDESDTSLSAGRLTDISAITDRAFVRPDRRSLAR
jgi:hypothetical protein